MLVTETLLRKFIQNLFTYAEGYKVRVSLCNLLNENYCLKAKLMEIKFIYRVKHGCIEFKLKISDRKRYFPCFFDNPNGPFAAKPSRDLLFIKLWAIT